jgi:hypothetical protein
VFNVVAASAQVLAIQFVPVPGYLQAPSVSNPSYMGHVAAVPACVEHAVLARTQPAPLEKQVDKKAAH